MIFMSATDATDRISALSAFPNHPSFVASAQAKV
jgi:hypothetical protein